MSQWDKVGGGKEEWGGKGDIFIMYPLPIIAWLEGGVGEARTFISWKRNFVLHFHSFLEGGGGARIYYSSMCSCVDRKHFSVLFHPIANHGG
jgi:hypothetical protein